MHPYLRRLISLVITLGLVAVACATPDTFVLTRVQVANVQVLPGADGFLHPLTGVVSYVPQPWQERRALGIKVGNSARELPQAGIEHADLIYEQPAEGAVTRFVAVFLTQGAERVGPVRSVRTADAAILEPLGALFGYSGGVGPIVAGVRSSERVVDVGVDRRPGAYGRDRARQAPYNYYTSPEGLWEGSSAGPPEPQFDFLTTADDPTVGGEADASEVSFRFADRGAEIRYTYNADTGRYERHQGGAPHITENDVQLSFRNVIIQMVEVREGTTVDQAGNRTRDIDLVGQGTVLIVRAGRAFRGTWSREALADRTSFADEDGQPIPLAPGPTIVELVPSGRDIFVQ